MTTLYRVILPVSDIDRATEFYSALLQQEGKRVSTGRHYFDCGGTVLACLDTVADGDGAAPLPSNPGILYFSVEDLEGAQERLHKAGGQVTREIAVRPWGERSLYAQDPFDNPICFVDEQTVFLG